MTVLTGVAVCVNAVLILEINVAVLTATVDCVATLDNAESADCILVAVTDTIAMLVCVLEVNLTRIRSEVIVTALDILDA